MIFFEENLYIAQQAGYSAPFGIAHLDNPRIGYKSSAAYFIASSSVVGRDSQNMANPSTSEFWQADGPGVHTIEFRNRSQVDYIGIARHNFHLMNGTYLIQYKVNIADSWVSLGGPRTNTDGAAILHQFELKAADLYWRIIIDEAAGGYFEQPTIAVIHCGQMLVLPRRIYVGHTPINYGRHTKLTSPKSESGQFLGRKVLSSTNKNSVSMSNIDAAYYRTYFDEFVVWAQTKPFFFAWRPASYPKEVGYCWTTDDIRPSNDSSVGTMAFDFDLEALSP